MDGWIEYQYQYQTGPSQMAGWHRASGGIGFAEAEKLFRFDVEVPKSEAGRSRFTRRRWSDEVRDFSICSFSLLGGGR